MEPSSNIMITSIIHSMKKTGTHVGKLTMNEIVSNLRKYLTSGHPNCYLTRTHDVILLDHEIFLIFLKELEQIPLDSADDLDLILAKFVREEIFVEECRNLNPDQVVIRC